MLSPNARKTSTISKNIEFICLHPLFCRPVDLHIWEQFCYTTCWILLSVNGQQIAAYLDAKQNSSFLWWWQIVQVLRQQIIPKLWSYHFSAWQYEALNIEWSVRFLLEIAKPHSAESSTFDSSVHRSFPKTTRDILVFSLKLEMRPVFLLWKLVLTQKKTTCYQIGPLPKKQQTEVNWTSCPKEA